MGKKKKSLQAEIDRLNAQRPKTEVTSYKNIDQTPRTSVAATLGSSMTGYKTSSGPSMYGATYNYKNINSCGPSFTGVKIKEKEEPKSNSTTKRGEEIISKMSTTKTYEPPKKLESRQQSKQQGYHSPETIRFTEPSTKERFVKLRLAPYKLSQKVKAKADEIEGKPGRAGVKKMAAESLFRLGEAGVKSAASLIANKRKANLGSSNVFAPRQRSGGGGYSSKSQPSYDELLSKYQS
jgi:hypothetical protein